MNHSGIYKIESIMKSERFYIGSAFNIKQRKYLHLSKLRNNKHHSIILQRHFNKYGESDLIFSVIEKCDKNVLLEREQIYIDLFNPIFNICKKAGNTAGLPPWNKGKIGAFSEEAIKRMAISRIGNKNSLGRIGWNKGKKIGTSGMKGKHHSEEVKLRMSNLRKGNPVSESCRIAAIKANQGNKYWVGRKHSEVTKQKMKIAWKSRRLKTA